MSTSSTSKTKATWIPSFHEIFVDICVEQTLKGNRPGTHFTKEGWRNIAESFHAKTGMRYDRRQLKNHWDSTKEQWKVWCKLTEAKSMKWDPETKTFSASPEDWTKYIQANPDAAPFRFKELQHTDKLKIIYDGTITNQHPEHSTRGKRQNSKSTTSLMHTKCPSDAIVLHSGNGQRPKDDENTLLSKMKATWTPLLHEIFVDICLDETLKGNRPGTHFTKEGWRNIVESFYKKAGLRYDRMQLKNHWDLTKEQWKVWCKLTDTSHMKWDQYLNKFGASEEEWENYIQVNPDAAQFRYKVLRNINKLEIIYDGTINTGETDPRPSRRRRLNDSSTSSPLPLNELRTSKSEMKTEHLYEVESRSVLTNQNSAPINSSTLGKPSYSIGECIECLDGMEEVEQGNDLYMFALDIFLKEEYREIFLQLKKPSLRIAWLQRLQLFSPPLH